MELTSEEYYHDVFDRVVTILAARYSLERYRLEGRSAEFGRLSPSERIVTILTEMAAELDDDRIMVVISPTEPAFSSQAFEFTIVPALSSLRIDNIRVTDKVEFGSPTEYGDMVRNLLRAVTSSNPDDIQTLADILDKIKQLHAVPLPTLIGIPTLAEIAKFSQCAFVVGCPNVARLAAFTGTIYGALAPKPLNRREFVTKTLQQLLVIVQSRNSDVYLRTFPETVRSPRSDALMEEILAHADVMESKINSLLNAYTTSPSIHPDYIVYFERQMDAAAAEPEGLREFTSNSKAGHKEGPKEGPKGPKGPKGQSDQGAFIPPKRVHKALWPIFSFYVDTTTFEEQLLYWFSDVLRIKAKRAYKLARYIVTESRNELWTIQWLCYYSTNLLVKELFSVNMFANQSDRDIAEELVSNERLVTDGAVIDVTPYWAPRLTKDDLYKKVLLEDYQEAGGLTLDQSYQKSGASRVIRRMHDNLTKVVRTTVERYLTKPKSPERDDEYVNLRTALFFDIEMQNEEGDDDNAEIVKNSQPFDILFASLQVFAAGLITLYTETNAKLSISSSSSLAKRKRNVMAESHKLFMALLQLQLAIREGARAISTYRPSSVPEDEELADLKSLISKGSTFSSNSQEVYKLKSYRKGDAYKKINLANATTEFSKHFEKLDQDVKRKFNKLHLETLTKLEDVGEHAFRDGIRVVCGSAMDRANAKIFMLVVSVIDMVFGGNTRVDDLSNDSAGAAAGDLFKKYIADLILVLGYAAHKAFAHEQNMSYKKATHGEKIADYSRGLLGELIRDEAEELHKTVNEIIHKYLLPKLVQTTKIAAARAAAKKEGQHIGQQLLGRIKSTISELVKSVSARSSEILEAAAEELNIIKAPLSSVKLLGVLRDIYKAVDYVQPLETDIRSRSIVVAGTQPTALIALDPTFSEIERKNIELAIENLVMRNTDERKLKNRPYEESPETIRTFQEQGTDTRATSQSRHRISSMGRTRFVHSAHHHHDHLHEEERKKTTVEKKRREEQQREDDQGNPISPRPTLPSADPLRGVSVGDLNFD